MRGFVRIAAAVPTCEVAHVEANIRSTLSLWRRAHEEGHALVVFPELGLTGYTVRDLFHDHHLLDMALEGLARLAARGQSFDPLAVVGLPLRVGPGVYNVAVALQGGRALAVVPKSYLPNYREFEEARWFRPGAEIGPGTTIDLGKGLGHGVPFGTDLLLQARGAPSLAVGLELCEDFWVSVPPSAFQTVAGATVVVNLSASNFIVGKAELRRLLARASSDRGKCAYVYVAAGPGESSTDLAFDADAFVAENGAILASSTRFARHEQLVSVDVDLERLERERMVTTTFGDCAREHARSFRRVPFVASAEITPPLRRSVARHPFVPRDRETLDARCWEIFEIQTNALATRMRALGRPRLVLGISGGLDSTQAALVAATALDLRDQPRSDLLCVTMPGLGTSAGTRNNATQLAEALGARLRVVSISEASRMILQMLGHPAVEDPDGGEQDVAALVERLRKHPELGDVTLENVQARLRTLLLMSLANAEGGLVVGTGDLSEKALGWSTYAGDHIAMYDVNAGVPKTLIQLVIRWVANERVGTWSVGDPQALRQTLFAILDTPISPELLPADPEGQIAQLTEAQIGPYELHDFFLYHLVRDGARPARVLDLAQVAFGADYRLPELKRWFELFLRRFFGQQFKRSCTADGPKVGQVALSPRGDWRMPSDAQVDSWLEEVDAYRP